MLYSNLRWPPIGLVLTILIACGCSELLAQESVSGDQTATSPQQSGGEGTKKTTTSQSKTANQTTKTAAATETTIMVQGEEVPSAYGAPPALSRSRFSNLVNAYVLPPWGVYAAAIYEGDALRFNRPDHNYTAEVELGLPYRFGVAIENAVETFRGVTQERSFSVEGRYAFADWDRSSSIRPSSWSTSLASVTSSTTKAHLRLWVKAKRRTSLMRTHRCQVRSKCDFS